MAWLSSGEPETLEPVSGYSVPTTALTFDDRRVVELVIDTQDPVSLLGDASGKVTFDGCEVGAELASGAHLLSVDDKPVRVLATSVPPWRDLRVGMRGPDVEAVQAELARLGVDVPGTGLVDAATAAATRHWITAGSGRLLDEMVAVDRQLVLPVERLVWSPLPLAVVGECPVPLGSRVTPGQPLASTMVEVKAVRLREHPQVLPDLPRTLYLGDAAVSLGEDFAVSDAQDVTTLLGTAELARYLAAQGDDARLDAEVAMSEPVNAVSVPPAAVVGAGTGTTCLVDESGAMTDVVVIASQLGQAVVAPAVQGDELPARVVLDLTGERSCS